MTNRANACSAPARTAASQPIYPIGRHGRKGQLWVDGFWSITVYNAEGYLEPNQYNVYFVNMTSAKRGADGSIVIQFGGCDGQIPNCLAIMRGWNYTVRLFRPRAQILDDVDVSVGTTRELNPTPCYPCQRPDITSYAGRNETGDLAVSTQCL
jgi:Protein of unknown function (DUF1214)